MTEDKTIYTGYETSCTSLSAVSITGGSGEFTYEWSTGETLEEIQVCPSETTIYTLVISDAKGCTATATVTVNVEDVSCGKKGDKVVLCHNGKSICIAPQAVPALLRKGATFGSCDEQKPNVAIEKVTAWPNPAYDHSQIRVTAEKSFKASLALYSIKGSPVSQNEIKVKKGSTDFDLSLENLPKGVYVVKILGNGFESKGLKLIKK
jgi:hypothetical protein